MSRRELNGVLTVDPGMEGTGWAYWTLRGAIIPEDTGVLKTTVDRKLTIMRMLDLSRKFADVLKRWTPRVVVLEGVSLWSGSKRSQTAAAGGATFKLATLLGIYMQSCDTHGILAVHVIDPRAWTGNLNEEQVVRRVALATGESYQQHAADAVGIGLAMTGLL